METADYKLLSLNYLPDGENLVVFNPQGQAFEDSELNKLWGYQQKLTQLAVNWGYKSFEIVSDRQELKFSVEKIMPDFVIKHDLILNKDLTSILGDLAHRGQIDKYGIVMLPGEEQICVSTNDDQLIWTPNKAAQKKRGDYFHPEDLERMRRESRQQEQFELTFRSIHKRPGGLTAFFTNSYQTFEGTAGTVYQISKRLDYQLRAV